MLPNLLPFSSGVISIQDKALSPVWTSSRSIELSHTCIWLPQATLKIVNQNINISGELLHDESVIITSLNEAKYIN